MERRKRIDMTSSEFAWTAASIMLLGVLLGWSLYGAPRLSDRIGSAGSAAEWIAAVGTWVIGLGAWRYARDSHRHNVTLAKRVWETELESTIAGLGLLLLRTARLTAISRSYEYYEEHPEANRGPLLENILTHTMGEVMEFHLTDSEKKLLTIEMLQTYSLCDANRSHYQFLAGDTQHLLLKGALDLATDVGAARVDALSKIARLIAANATALKELLGAEGIRLRAVLDAERPSSK